LAADSESGKCTEHSDEEDKEILQGQWLSVQQIDEEKQCRGEGERKEQKQPIKPQAISSGRGVSFWGPLKGRVGPPEGLKKNKAPHKERDCSLLTVLMLVFFTDFFQVFVEQTNLYHQQS
jgi:hypothetical protein